MKGRMAKTIKEITRNRRLLIEADLTAVERPQRVNRGLQSFVRSGHNFPTMKPLD